MNTSNLRGPLCALASALLLGFSGLALAEPPSRAARLGYIDGSVSFSPAGEPDWVRAPINRPLTTGDRLWTAEDARAELQIGGAAIRMGPSTSMTLLNLDDRITQVQLSQGTLKIRVRSFGPRQTFEVATPNLAFTLSRPGEYRIEVDPNDDATAVVVQRGEAEVYGNGASYTVDARRSYRFYGTDLSDYDVLTARRDDDLDRWSRERDRRSDGSVSARYVSSEVVGYEDLDVHGSWRVDQTYGNVWIPRRVAAGWTPYRDGHWSWIDPWGWTWVDDAPWGYAVSHYGRWAHIDGYWAWVPGPRRERAVYAPALVAFVGGSNFQISVTLGTAAPAIGWFPLAPREVYQPSYPVSRVYFDSINRSNTVVAPTTITNIYNTTIVNNTTNVTNVTYANRQIAGAMVAVPAQTFVQSQPVAKATVRIAQAAAVSAPVVRVASVAPVQQSVQGGAPSAGSSKPPARERAVVARATPPPAPVPFVVQQKELAAKPGRPIDDAQRAQLKPAVPAAVEPKVRVIATAPTPSATALPPATAPAGRSAQARKATADETGAKADANKATPANDEAGRAEAAKADKVRRDAATADAANADASKAAAANAAAERAEAAKVDAAKVDANRAARANEEAARAEESKADKARRDAATADAAKANASKAAAAEAAATRAEAAKADANKAARANDEAGRAEAAKADKARRDATKADAAKADAVRAEATRADAAKAAEAKADAARAEAAKADASKAAAGNAAAARAAADRNAADKADEARAAAAKSEANKAAGAKDEARADKAKADQARSEAARADAAKAQAIQAEAARAQSAKAASARAEAAKADAARAEAARAETAKAATAKADHARAEAAKADAARADAEAAKAQAAKANAAKAEATKAEATKAEAARLAQAQVPAAAQPPKARASGPKSNTDAADEDEKKGGGRKP